TSILHIISTIALKTTLHSVSRPRPHRHLHSFPTRRSSDLPALAGELLHEPAHPFRAGRPRQHGVDRHACPRRRLRAAGADRLGRDRKSTRLNSSHVASSYAVFCLKKKIRRHCKTHKVL